MSATTNISTRSELCSGCGCCRLACSLVKTGMFRPSQSRILIDRIEGKERFNVSFTSDCDNCGYCARYCFYNALEVNKP